VAQLVARGVESDLVCDAGGDGTSERVGTGARHGDGRQYGAQVEVVRFGVWSVPCLD